MAVKRLLCSTALLLAAHTAQARVIDASTFPGQIGDQITACIAALPVQGGVCDARNLPATGSIAPMTITRSGVTILGPCGQYTVSGTILLNAVRALRWVGCGEDFSTTGTRFMWAGGGGAAMFQLTASRGNLFEHFSIWADIPAPLAIGIGQSPGAGGVTTDNAFRDLIIEANRDGGIDIGMRWYGAGGNNDASLIERVSVNNYSTAAYSIENSQSKSHLFLHSQCNGSTSSKYCVTTGLGARAGSFMAVNMLGDNNSVADFFLGSPDDTINIIGGDFENSARFLMTTAATGTGWPVLVQGVRIAANNLAPDNRLVVYQMRGGFTFSNNIIDGASAGKTPLISFEPSSLASTAKADGNVIRWATGTVGPASQPFVGANGAGALWRLIGNTITDGSGVTFPIPDSLGGVSCAGPLGASAVVVNGIVRQC